LEEKAQFCAVYSSNWQIPRSFILKNFLPITKNQLYGRQNVYGQKGNDRSK
jgi:hypothetical protein